MSSLSANSNQFDPSEDDQGQSIFNDNLGALAEGAKVNYDSELSRLLPEYNSTSQHGTFHDFLSDPIKTSTSLNNILDQSLLDSSTSSYAQRLYFTSDNFPQPYLSSACYPSSNSWFPFPDGQTSYLGSNPVDTTMAELSDVGPIISADDENGFQGSRMASTYSTDSPAEGTSANISRLTPNATSSRRNKRGEDGHVPTCEERKCNGRTFSDPGCLSRHIREKHGSEIHYCPITTCKRNQKGFPRRTNLLEHKKKVHPKAFTNSVIDSFARSPIEDRDDENVTSGSSGARNSMGGFRLNRKLNTLRELRGDLDREIEILEGAIMSDDEE